MPTRHHNLNLVRHKKLSLLFPVFFLFDLFPGFFGCFFLGLLLTFFLEQQGTLTAMFSLFQIFSTTFFFGLFLAFFLSHSITPKVGQRS